MVIFISTILFDAYEGAIEPETEAANLLAEITYETSIIELNNARQVWWKDYWNTSYVDFGTEDENLNKVQKYYYGVQYILGSSAKKEKQLLDYMEFGVSMTHQVSGVIII